MIYPATSWLDIVKYNNKQVDTIYNLAEHGCVDIQGQNDYI